MRRLILLGGVALLLFNALTLLFFFKKTEKAENFPVASPLSPPKKTLFLQKGNSTLKLTFSSSSSLAFLSSVEVELKRGPFKIVGRAPRGILLGRKLTLLNFSGSACGWRFKAQRFELSLEDLSSLTLRKFSFVRGRELFKGISTSAFELEKLCAFLKKERRTPH